MLLLGLVGGGLVLQQYLTTPPDDVAYEHTEGPFRAAVATDGSFQLGPAVPAFRPGEAFGWSESFCARLRTALLLQARLVRLTDNEVMLYREHMVAADARGCNSAAWDIVLPGATPPGRYQLQRWLLLTPRTGAPRLHHLPPLAVDVIP